MSQFGSAELWFAQVYAAEAPTFWPWHPALVTVSVSVVLHLLQGLLALDLFLLDS